MDTQSISSNTLNRPHWLTQESKGLLLGILAVISFSFTLPFTRYVTGYIDPWFLGFGRTVMAAPFAMLALWLGGAAIPTKRQFILLGISAFGITLGFPVSISVAMSLTEASRGGVVIGALPLATAIVAAILAKERMPKMFWVMSVIGAIVMFCFSLLSQTKEAQLSDIWLLVAIATAAFGYASGGKLSKEVPGWQVICWTLVVGSPFLLGPTLYFLPSNLETVPAPAWLSLTYLVLISQLFGFFLWNKGMALGGIARVSQTQLLQPFFTLFIAALFFGEALEITTVFFAALIVTIVASGKYFSMTKK